MVPYHYIIVITFETKLLFIKGCPIATIPLVILQESFSFIADCQWNAFNLKRILSAFLLLLLLMLYFKLTKIKKYNLLQLNTVT